MKCPKYERSNRSSHPIVRPSAWDQIQFSGLLERGWNLFNHFFGKFPRWDSDLRVLVFEMVPQFVILFQRQNVFGGAHAMFLEPFRIDVEGARRFSRGPKH